MRFCSTEKDKEFDVLIVGGGMIGPSLAAALSNTPLSSSLRVGIIESKPLEAEGFFKDTKSLPPIPDLRTCTLSPSTVSFLEAIGVWESINEMRVAPFYSMKVWDSLGIGNIEFEASDLNQTTLGYVAENSIVTGSIFSLLKQQNKVQVFAPATLKKIEVGNEHKLTAVETSDGMKMSTKLLVGADGVSSVVREKSGISSVGFSYNQKGVVCTVKLEDPYNTTAWQRFLPEGVIALLPVRLFFIISQKLIYDQKKAL